MKTRGRKVLRDILARKGRTVLVALSIMIGVFGAVALMSTNDLILTQIEEDINPDEIAMARAFVTVPTAGTQVDNDAYLARLNEQPGVILVEGQTLAPVFWQQPGDDHFMPGEILAFSSPFGEIQLEGMRLVKGDWPRPGQHEIAIETRTADAHELAVGDTLMFRALGDAAGDAATAEWTITATVFHPYWVGNGENDVEQRIYANYDDAQDIAGFSGFTAFYLRYTDTDVAEDQAQHLESIIAKETNYIPLGVWLDDPNDYFLLGEVKQITNILDMLAIVALVVSGFLVTNVINTIVVEQKRQIGVMKSIGATRLDNFFIYAGIAFIYGVIGTVPGVILGVIAGSAMAQNLASLAHTMIEGFNVSTLGVVVGVVMGLLVPIFAALIPVFNGTRVTIMDAMTDLGISTTWGTGPIARLIKRLPLPVNIRQALSNVAQKKGRLALTVITLTLATAAFMGVFAMFTVVTDEIDKLYNTFKYKIAVYPTEAQDYEAVRNELLGVDGVADVYPGVAFEVEILDFSPTAVEVGAGEAIDDSSTKLPAFGFDPASGTFEMTFTDGTGWDNDPTREGVVLSKSAADTVNKKVGDTIVVSAGGRTAEYEVIGVHSYPVAFIGMRWQDLAQLAGFVTDDNGTPDDFTDDTPLPTAFFVALEEADLTGKEVQVYIDLISERVLAQGITAEYENQVQEQEDTAENLMMFQMIFQITSAVMAAVGAIGLLTTLSMSVFERQKEIGVMRSIGAGSSTIISQFLVEGVMIGVIAWFVAIPLSYLLAVALLNAMEFDEFIDFSYPAWVLGLGLGGMIVIAAVASLWPSITAARRTVSDILRYQ